MTKEDADKCTKPMTLRMTADLYNRVHDRAAQAQMNDSAWIKMALEYAIDHMNETRPNDIAVDSLVRCLSYDEGVADIIYQKVAEKLRLTDLISELIYFATHLNAANVPELCRELRDTTSRMVYLVRDPVDMDELISLNYVSGLLVWTDREWTLADFYNLPEDERNRYQFFYMETCDPTDRRRSEGIYFWNRKEDASKFYPPDFFEEGETVMVHAANFRQSGQSGSNKGMKQIPGIEERIVKMVRYISRDENLGDTGSMADSALATYSVRNVGYFPRGIPCEFTFGWVSDRWNKGEYQSYDELKEAVQNHKDDSIRPVFDAVWHYTKTRLRCLKETDGKPMFDSYAKPECLVEAGQYTGGDGRFIEPNWSEIEDPTRFDAEERKKYKTYIPQQYVYSEEKPAGNK